MYVTITLPTQSEEILASWDRPLKRKQIEVLLRHYVSAYVNGYTAKTGPDGLFVVCQKFDDDRLPQVFQLAAAVLPLKCTFAISQDCPDPDFE